MKRGEKGFTIIELAVAIAIMAFIGSAAATSIFQVIEGTERGNNQMTVVRQVHNAGYWISRDTQRAESVVTDNLTAPDFFILTWVEQDYGGGELIHHSVTYFFTDLSDGIGEIMRSHWSSGGANEQTLVADYIYYDPGDPDDTSKASYQSPVLTVQLTAILEDAAETREYMIKRRPNI